MPSRRFHITGLVQGVFFRASAKEKADALGIKGWARNGVDGSVEIHAEGREDALQEMERWCWQGPSSSRVDLVTVERANEEHAVDFSITR